MFGKCIEKFLINNPLLFWKIGQKIGQIFFTLQFFPALVWFGTIGKLQFAVNNCCWISGCRHSALLPIDLLLHFQDVALILFLFTLGRVAQLTAANKLT